MPNVFALDRQLFEPPFDVECTSDDDGVPTDIRSRDDVLHGCDERHSGILEQAVAGGDSKNDD